MTKKFRFEFYVTYVYIVIYTLFLSNHVRLERKEGRECHQMLVYLLSLRMIRN